MNRPLVAVLTPVYNGARFIADAIACVQAQTYRPLVHVILDNASTDETAQIIATASGPVPIVTRRNASLLPVAANFNAVVDLTPEDSAYFTILCADDGMAPQAIDRMIALALSEPDVRMVSGAERRNGVPTPARMPPTGVYPAAEVLARIIRDRAHIPFHHMLYRADQRRPDARFFNDAIVGFDAETVFELLSRGGRFGFIDAPIFDTAVHEGSLSSTWVSEASADAWEDLRRVEAFGAAALSGEDYAQAVRARRRGLLRKLLWWGATGKRAPFRRDYGRLEAAGSAPGLWDFADALFTWPVHIAARRQRNVQTAPPAGERP